MSTTRASTKPTRSSIIFAGKDVDYASVDEANEVLGQIIGPGLRARTAGGRKTEALLACNVLNRMTELGRPASYRIGH